MKKTILFMIMITLLSGCFFGGVYAEKEYDGYDENIIGLLKALEIFKGDENGELNLENNITRAEASSVLVSMIGVSSKTADKNIFSDITPEHWAYGIIQNAVDFNLIEGYENGKFLPEKNVTHAEFIAMLLRMLGYEDIAKIDGGYPLGYVKTAQAIDITLRNSWNYNEAITRYDAMCYIYNALHTEICETVFNTHENIELQKSEDNTILTKYLNIRRYEGQVSGNCKTAIYGEKASSKNQIAISGIVYTLKEQPKEDLLGYLVEYYLRDDDSDEVVYINAASKNKTVTFDAKQINNISGLKITYDLDGGLKTIKTNGEPVVIYNGTKETISLRELKDINGELTFLSIDNGSEYQYVFVKDREDYIISAIDNKNLIIYDLFGKPALDFDYESDGVKEILSFDFNSLMDITDVEVGDILSVYRDKSGKNISCIYSEKKTVVGTITSVREDDYQNVFVNVGNNEIKVSNSLIDAVKKGIKDAVEPKAGLYGTFYLTADNEIAYIADDEKNEEAVWKKYAFFIKGYIDEDENAVMKVINSDGKTAELKCAENIKVNGTAKKPGNVFSYINAVSESGNPIIHYKKNGAGEVSQILFDDGTQNKNTPCLEATLRDKTVSAISYGGLIDYKYILGAETVAYYIYNHTGEIDENTVKVINPKDINNLHKYKLELYDIEDLNTASAAVLYGDNEINKWLSKRMIIEDCGYKYDEKKDEVVYSISGYSGVGNTFERISLNVSPSAYLYVDEKKDLYKTQVSYLGEINSIEYFEKGDIILYQLDKNGDIEAYYPLFSMKNDYTDKGMKMLYAGVDMTEIDGTIINEFSGVIGVFGSVYETDNINCVMKLVIGEGNGATQKVFDFKWKKILRYDTKKHEITEAEPTDIMSIVQTGSDSSASKLFINLTGTTADTIVIYD